MKRTVSSLAVLVALMVTTAPLAVWSKVNPTPNAIPGLVLNPNASGTKLSGPLGISYQRLLDPGEDPANLDVNNENNCDLGRANTIVVLRLKKGNDERVFGIQTTSTPADVAAALEAADPVAAIATIPCISDFASQVALVEELVLQVPGGVLDAFGFTSFEWKSWSIPLINAPDGAISVDVEIAAR